MMAAGYILTDTCDIHSALANISFQYDNGGCRSIKVLAQETFKSLIEEKISKYTTDPLPKLTLNLDPEFLSHDLGVHFHLFRYDPEAVAMINHFERNRFEWISIWSENVAMVIPMAKQVFVSRKIFINAPTVRVDPTVGTPAPGIKSDTTFSKFIQDFSYGPLNDPDVEWPAMDRECRAELLLEACLTIGSSFPSLAAVQTRHFRPAKLFEEDGNILKLNYYGQPSDDVPKRSGASIIINLGENNDNQDDSIFMFGINALLNGYCLRLIGTKDAFRTTKPWMALADGLKRRDHRNVMQLIQIDQQQQQQRPERPLCREATFLQYEQEIVKTVPIDSSADLTSVARLMTELRPSERPPLLRSIWINLQEFDMKSMVE